MAVAKLLLKNDVGLVLDITESPLGCTVYDLNGNEIGGGGVGSNLQYCDITINNNRNSLLILGFNYLTDEGYVLTDLTVAENASTTVKGIYYLDNDDAVIEIYNEAGTDPTLVSADNCTLSESFITRTAEGPSSITVSYSN